MNDQYSTEISCLSKDQQHILLTVNVTLKSRQENGKSWQPTKSWLDNCYRPELHRRVQAMAVEFDAQVLQGGNPTVQQRLTIIGQETYYDVPLPQ